LTFLTIQFSGFLVDEQERYIAYSIPQFVSDCGGLMGLFLGCSVLSLVEIFYHTIARCTEKKKDNANSQSNRDAEELRELNR
jgi:Amiloride-sensitive sodium channel